MEKLLLPLILSAKAYGLLMQSCSGPFEWALLLCLRNAQYLGVLGLPLHADSMHCYELCCWAVPWFWYGAVRTIHADVWEDPAKNIFVPNSFIVTIFKWSRNKPAQLCQTSTAPGTLRVEEGPGYSTEVDTSMNSYTLGG